MNLLNMDKPTIEAAWAAFENDLQRRGATDEEIDAAKLVWHSGACALGIVFCNSNNTPQDKLASYETVLEYMATCGTFPRLAELMRGKPQ